jgi:hypothetical protein
MASLLNAVPNAKLTATKPRTYDQVATEPEAGFPEAEALCGGEATLGRGAFWVLFCRKKVPEEFTLSI